MLGDLARGDAVAEQRRRFKIDAYFALDAAHARHLRNATHTEQRARHRVIDKPAQFVRLPTGRMHGIRQQCAAGDGHLGDHRLLDITRQVNADARDGIAYIVQCRFQGRFQMEFDEGDRLAFSHRGNRALDALQCRHRVLDTARDLGFKLRRRSAGQGHRNGDHGERDVREACDRKLLEGMQARDAQRHEKQDRGKRTMDRPGREVHGVAAASATTRTRSPSPRKPAPRSTTREPSSSPPSTSMRWPTMRPTSTRCRCTRSCSSTPKAYA